MKRKIWWVTHICVLKRRGAGVISFFFSLFFHCRPFLDILGSQMMWKKVTPHARTEMIQFLILHIAGWNLAIFSAKPKTLCPLSFRNAFKTNNNNNNNIYFSQSELEKLLFVKIRNTNIMSDYVNKRKVKVSELCVTFCAGLVWIWQHWNPQKNLTQSLHPWRLVRRKKFKLRSALWSERNHAILQVDFFFFFFHLEFEVLKLDQRCAKVKSRT